MKENLEVILIQTLLELRNRRERAETPEVKEYYTRLFIGAYHTTQRYKSPIPKPLEEYYDKIKPQGEQDGNRHK